MSNPEIQTNIEDSLSISYQESEWLKKQREDIDEEVRAVKEKNRIYKQNIESLKKTAKVQEENVRYLKLQKEKLQAKLQTLTAENTALKAATINSGFLTTISENSTFHQKTSEELQEQRKKSARLSQKVEQLEATIEELMKAALKEPKTDNIDSYDELTMKLQRSVLENDPFKREVCQLKKENQILKKDLAIACKGRNVIQRKYKEIMNQRLSLRMSQSQLSPNRLASQLSGSSFLFRKKFVDIDSDETDEDPSIRMNSQNFYIFAELRDHLQKISRQSEQIRFLNMVSVWSELQMDRKEASDDIE